MKSRTSVLSRRELRAHIRSLGAYVWLRRYGIVDCCKYDIDVASSYIFAANFGIKLIFTLALH